MSDTPAYLYTFRLFCNAAGQGGIPLELERNEEYPVGHMHQIPFAKEVTIGIKGGTVIHFAVGSFIVAWVETKKANPKRTG